MSAKQVVGFSCAFNCEVDQLIRKPLVEHKFENFPMEDYDKVNAVNVRGPFALTKECLPLLTTAGEGKGPNQHATVINIASIDGIA